MKKLHNEPFDDIIGGSRNSVIDVKKLPSIDTQNLTSGIDREIAILLAVHPQIKAKFRHNKISSLGENDKKEFLRTIQILLDIDPQE